MTNYGFTGRLLSKKLKKDTIRKGGLEQINTPVLNCKIASELETVTVELGGYPTLVNYNKDREIQHQKNRENREIRKLKRNIRNWGLGKSGLTHNIIITQQITTSRAGGNEL